MKRLDRYVAKNFLFGYFIALSVMMGLFLTIDLFLNLDEFSEYLEKGCSIGQMLMVIVHYYSVHCCLWYKNMAGMVMVIAAVFSLGRMTRNNELIAVMASGTSLKRILTPILFLSLLLSGLMVVDQEFIIPKLSHQLTQNHDELMEESVYDLWFAGDNRGSLISTPRYVEKTQTLYDPLIILREKLERPGGLYQVTGKIQAAKAVYDAERGGWILTNGQLLRLPVEGQQAATNQRPIPIDFYESNLTAADIPVRRREGFINLLSINQLTELERNPGARKTDLAELALQKNSRITDPLVNLIMLMVALPILVCRDPKVMKTAIGASFLITISCFIVVFVCKLFATEVVFGQIRPALWTWIPIFIFFPIAWIEIDSMRT